MIGVLTSVSETADINHCEFYGAGFDRGSRTTRIDTCLFDAADCTTGGSQGVSGYRSLAVRNSRFVDSRNCPLIVQNVEPVIAEALIEANVFHGAAKGAIWLRNVGSATVRGNTISDCNRSGDSSDFYRGGINFYGCSNGLVEANIIENTPSGGGEMQYAVVSATNLHSIIVRNNSAKGMTVAASLRI